VQSERGDSLGPGLSVFLGVLSLLGLLRAGSCNGEHVGLGFLFVLSESFRSTVITVPLVEAGLPESLSPPKLLVVLSVELDGHAGEDRRSDAGVSSFGFRFRSFSCYAARVLERAQQDLGSQNRDALRLCQVSSSVHLAAHSPPSSLTNPSPFNVYVPS
jgi:hypothetical protein